MTPVLTFTRGELDREVVKLGDVVIGEVAPHHGTRARATFSLRLPDSHPSSFRPARSIAQAREMIRASVSEWFLRAGVFYPGQLIECARDNGAGGQLYNDDAIWAA
jgi:hypothetical protein